MNSQTRRDIRFGLTSLAVSSLLMTVGLVARGPMSGLTAEFLLRDATSPTWAPAWGMGIAASVLQVYGFLGLYRYLTYQADSRIAFWAALLSATALALFIGSATFMTYQAPVLGKLYIQGDEALTTVWNARYVSDIGKIDMVLTGGGYILGPILFAIAIWRDGRLPKWTGIVFALSFLLTAYPVYFPAEVLGMVLQLISTSAMAWIGWQEAVLAAAPVPAGIHAN